MTQPPKQRPIIIEPYNPAWPTLFEQEKRSILKACNGVIGIEHIGSTAIPHLAAKPVIDMMLTVTDEKAAATCIEALKAIGYCHLPGAFWKLPGRYDLIYKDVDGKRAFNLHIAGSDGIFAGRHLPFRDYLCSNPEARMEYEALKIALAERFVTDMDAYASAKNDFVASVLQKAPGSAYRSGL
jgi:GrpB-like predicted nucleotidyltransferase (UPF0157 family)